MASQFKYYPLVWMFQSRKLNYRISSTRQGFEIRREITRVAEVDPQHLKKEVAE